MNQPPVDSVVSERKQRSHERIVDAATRALRRDGYAGVGVAAVMRDAGLTHGGFYAHFDSRDAMLAEALEHAGRESGAALQRRIDAAAGRGGSPFRALVEAYLSDALLAAPEAGCPVAALGSEMPRQAPVLRGASAAAVRRLVRRVGRTLGPDVDPGQAGPIAATLVGGLQLARALGTPAEGRALLAASRAALLDRYDLARGTTP